MSFYGASAGCFGTRTVHDAVLAFAMFVQVAAGAGGVVAQLAFLLFLAWGKERKESIIKY